MKIRYYIPASRKQGNCVIIGTETTMETARENALWEFNSMREHDGQNPVKNLPPGTKSERIE